MSAMWQSACRQWALARGLGPSVLRKLAAFGTRLSGNGEGEEREGEERDGEEEEIEPFAAWTRAPVAGFEALEAAAEARAGALRAAMIERLGLTLPRARAEDYARRLDALLRGLGELASGASAGQPGQRPDAPGLPVLEARLLRLALSARLSEALGRPERRAARVRDIIDFYHGQSSVLVYGGAGLKTPGELARAASFRAIGPGIALASVEALSTSGPVHMHLLRLRGPHLRALHLGPEAAPLDRLVASAGAVAGISGGYVLCSEMDLEPPSRHADPVGLVVQDGEVVSPPVFPRACLMEGPGGIEIRTVGPVGLSVQCGGALWTVAAHNDARAAAVRPVAFNRVWGPVSPEHDGLSLALLGRRVIGVARGPLPIPKAGLVLTLPSGTELPEQAIQAMTPGAEVRYRLPFEVWSAMAGGPMLLSEEREERRGEEGRDRDIDLAAEQFVPEVPPYTFAADETLGQSLLPRMVAGLTAEGELIVAAIDGRNFRRGVGMTLGQCRDLLAALGCTRAMNLDGGDSKRMVVEGRIVDLPGSQLEWDLGEPGGPDAAQLAEVRPVYSALLFMGSAPPFQA
jgi:hypothetical protein